MAEPPEPETFARNTFWLTMIGVALYAAAVIIFIL